MKKARYILVEGLEGCGKTTQCNLLAETLRARGYKVLLTKEPGTPLAPLTMALRGIMLDKQYDHQLTIPARELISQAIRSIHLEKVVFPNMNEYDFIIQDRGMLSGLAYGVACGNSEDFIKGLMNEVTPHGSPFAMYTDVVYLQGNIASGLAKAQSSKQEFKAGDAIEAKGVDFLNAVGYNMKKYSEYFRGVRYINVDGKSIDEVSAEIMEALKLTTGNK